MHSSAGIDTALLVHNERARGYGAHRLLQRAVRLLASRYDIVVAAPASPAALADAVAGSRARLVIAAGGDGTVHGVVNALTDAATLAILPTGTANDFARELGLPRDPIRVAARIAGGGADRTVDLLTVNGRRFCTVGGLGLVAHTTTVVLDLKATPGALRFAAQALGESVYRLAATAALLRPRPAETVRLRYREAEGGRVVEREVRTHSLFVVNHRMCGGGLCLPTGSRGDDGVFELAIVHESSRPRLVANFARLSRGAPIAPAALEVVRVTEAVLETPLPTAFVADGELLERATRFELRMLPGALRIRGAAALLH